MRRLASALLLCVAAAVWAQSPATEPMPSTGPAANELTRPTATAPSSRPATRPLAEVDPAARPLLDRVDAAYAKPGPRLVIGEIKGLFDVAGRRKAYTLHVEGRTDGAGRFLHDAGSAGLIVNNGKAAYLYDRRRDAFAAIEPMTERLRADQVPAPLIDILLDENPALLLALTTQPSELLRRSVKTIRPATQPAALVLERSTKRITLNVDADTGLIRSSDIDFVPLMEQRGAAGVVAAGARLTYTAHSFDPTPANAFDWQPPATATEFSITPPEQGPPSATQPTPR